MMYGTLDAAEQWGYLYTKTLLAAGFIQGASSPCIFFHPRFATWVVVHGDDFFVVARTAGRQHFEEVIRAEPKILCAAAG